MMGKFASEIKKIKDSGLFDAEWYQRQYPDTVGMDPIEHYLWVGSRLGRNPSPLFDTSYYQETYPDIAEAVINPLVHYLEAGIKEGRDPNPLFDTDWYLDTYPDVTASEMNPLAHYLQFGHVGDHNPNPLFDTKWYLETYPDVTESGINPLAHYLGAGVKKDYNPNPLFFTSWYLETYPDVAVSGIHPLTHYLQFGRVGDHDPNPLFDTKWYKETYPEVVQSALNPLVHYLEAGVKEGFDPNPLFFTSWYVKTYPDVVSSGLNPLVHYFSFGVRNRYDPNPLFNTSWYVKTYPDVAESGINPLVHFLQHGSLGDCNPNPFFDGRWYFYTYVDGIGEDMNPLAHYLRAGLSAGHAMAPPRKVPSNGFFSKLVTADKSILEAGDGLNVLMVLHGSISSNSGYQAYYHAAHLSAQGVNCIIAVPDREKDLEDFGKSVVCPILGYRDIEKIGLCFNNGRGPDIVHAWTPREIVRKFCHRLHERYTFKTIIHLEDNEEYLTAKAVGRKWEDLVNLSTKKLDKRIPDWFYHPFRGKQWLEQADGLTMVVDTLEKFNYAELPNLTIMPVVDERLFYPRPINWDLRKKLNIPENHLVIVYTGNVHLANQEEVGELYRSVALLNQKGCPATLIRTGTNQNNWHWGKLVKDDFVKDMGWVRRGELPEILATADILVQPGRAGNFNDLRIPCKLAEFFSIGRPVILPNCNWGSEVKHGHQGYVLDDANGENIAATVMKIRSDKEMKSKLGEKGIEFLNCKKNGTDSLNDLLNFYMELVLGRKVETKTDLSNNVSFPVLGDVKTIPTYNIPIVVVAYNRSDSLFRLLNSLKNARYHKEVDLIISLDDGNSNLQVCEIAKVFNWEHGKKSVLIHEDHLGLKNHILKSCDLSEQYDGVIVLEDDLLVSPVFHSYAQQAFDFYKDDPQVSGISLYSHGYNETANLPFTPLQDHTDAFFMQVPASWGVVWGKNQWNAFKKWLTNSDSVRRKNVSLTMPGDVLKWPETSWKKLFFQYIIEANKYFVYPRVSLTTNFGETGAHMEKNHVFQIPIRYGDIRYGFIKSEASLAKYDAFCEVIPESLNKVNSNLAAYDYSVDLYGMKPAAAMNSKYVLTTAISTNVLGSFGKEMTPLEANIIHQIAGEGISLVEKDSIIGNKEYERLISENLNDENILYHYHIYDWVLDAVIKKTNEGNNHLKYGPNYDHETDGELKQENELLLLQLHQVQEELETYYLKYQDLKNSGGGEETIGRML